MALSRTFAQFGCAFDCFKPRPGIFDVAFARMGRPRKDEALMIGDSLTSDIKGGSDYGIDTCWYNPSGAPCPTDVAITYEIHALGELLTRFCPGFGAVWIPFRQSAGLC